MTLAPIERDALGRPTDIGWVSGSALSAAVKCAASAVLWRVLGSGSGASRIGSALHDHIRQRNLYGVSAAIEMIPELATRHELTEDEAELFGARARAFEWNPPRGSVAELPICLFEDGRVEIVEGGRGQYDKLPADALIPMQLDLFWAEPHPLYRGPDGRPVCPPNSVLWVIDLKSGQEQYVEDVERNAQALAGAVLAAKLTGAKMVRTGLVFLRKGRGIWDVPEHDLDTAALEHAEAILVSAVHEVRRARAAHRRGLPLVYRQGPHCNLCGARVTCPAHLATLKSWLGDPAPIEPGALDDDQIRQLAELAPSMRSFVTSVEAALRTHVLATGRPIAMSDGRAWGPYGTTRTRYDGPKAIAALAADKDIGPELAKEAVRTVVGEKSIRTAIKRAHDAKGITGKVSTAWRRVFGRMMAASGITKTASAKWGYFKPTASSSEEKRAALEAMHGLPPDVATDDFEEDDEE